MKTRSPWFTMDYELLDMHNNRNEIRDRQYQCKVLTPDTVINNTDTNNTDINDTDTYTYSL